MKSLFSIKKCTSYLNAVCKFYCCITTYTKNVQGGSNMTGTNCDLFTHKQSRSYVNHLVL
jgi:hypothetical protein